MKHPTTLLALGLGVVAACSDSSDPDSPDAPIGTADARVVDADPPDADLPDADPVCDPDQLCLRPSAIDGSVPPAGRLAVAWYPQDDIPFEVALDIAWPAADVTRIDLAGIAAPSEPYQIPNPTYCPGGAIAGAIVVLSTDPNGDGAISPTEILAGFLDGTVYGIGQAITAWTPIDCAPTPPEFPEGFAAGVHVYTLEQPVGRLDGTVIELQTCEPGTPGCQDLNNPFL